MEDGLVQIYTGDGKGKSTAATGLMVRALGQGLRVLWVRFLKPAEPQSGEVRLLADRPGLTILTAGLGVIGRPVERQELAANITATFTAACDWLETNPCDLAVFDELNNALHRGGLELSEVLNWLDRRPAGLEVVLTGRHASEALIARADLVTEMRNVKHPYDRGIAARRGIEY